MPVNKTLILALMGLVLILTLAGVYVAHESYRTTITYEVLGGNEVNGTYVLYVKEIVNYGPFGGQQPLANASVWLYSGTAENHTFYAINWTNGSGVAVFHVKPGTYYVLFNTFKIGYQVDVNGNTLVVLNVAYLDKRFAP